VLVQSSALRIANQGRKNKLTLSKCVKHKSHLTALAQTCKLISSEALPIFYAENTFLIVFRYPETVPTKLRSFLDKIGQRSKSSLRKLIIRRSKDELSDSLTTPEEYTPKNIKLDTTLGSAPRTISAALLEAHRLCKLELSLRELGVSLRFLAHQTGPTKYSWVTIHFDLLRVAALGDPHEELEQQLLKFDKLASSEPDRHKNVVRGFRKLQRQLALS
jgi:hypothetical protein